MIIGKSSNSVLLWKVKLWYKIPNTLMTLFITSKNVPRPLWKIRLHNRDLEKYTLVYILKTIHQCKSVYHDLYASLYHSNSKYISYLYDTWTPRNLFQEFLVFNQFNDTVSKTTLIIYIFVKSWLILYKNSYIYNPTVIKFLSVYYIFIQLNQKSALVIFTVHALIWKYQMLSVSKLVLRDICKTAFVFKKKYKNLVQLSVHKKQLIFIYLLLLMRFVVFRQRMLSKGLCKLLSFNCVIDNISWIKDYGAVVSRHSDLNVNLIAKHNAFSAKAATNVVKSSPKLFLRCNKVLKNKYIGASHLGFGFYYVSNHATHSLTPLLFDRICNPSINEIHFIYNRNEFTKHSNSKYIYFINQFNQYKNHTMLCFNNINRYHQNSISTSYNVNNYIYFNHKLSWFSTVKSSLYSGKFQLLNNYGVVLPSLNSKCYIVVNGYSSLRFKNTTKVFLNLLN